MSGSVTVRIEGVNQIKAKAAKIGPWIAESVLIDVATKTRQIAYDLAPKDLSKGANGIAVRVMPLAAEVYTNDKYMVVQEFGRRPNQPGPPPSALRGWARRHGISTRDKRGRFTNGTVFMLSRSIGRKGFKGKYYMTQAARAAEAMLDAHVKAAAVKVETMWNGSIGGGL